MHRGRPIVAWLVAWKHGNDTCKISKRARHYFLWGWGRARKFPQTIANLPLNTERTDHDSRGHSIQFDWRRINGCRGRDGVLFPTVPSSSTNRNVVLRKWRSLDRSLKFYRKKERKEKRIEEEKRSGGCGWINLREKNFGKRFWKNETGENSDSQSYSYITELKKNIENKFRII